MIGVIYPTHHTLSGDNLGPVPPINDGFLLNDQGGYILQSNGGRIIIEISTLNKIKKLKERFEKLMS